MTKFLPNPNDTSWNNPGSSPIEDIRRAKKLIEEQVGYEPEPWADSSWLLDQCEKHYQETGIWPTHAILPGGIDVPIPPRREKEDDG